MSNLENILSEIFTASSHPSVIGAGSCLLGDDAAGVAVTDALIERFGPKPERFQVLSGGTAPECFTGEIKAFKPDLLVIIDAADMSLAAGSIRRIEPNEVEGISFSTHMLPLKVMLEYLKKEVGCRTAVIGIQPESLEFGAEMTAGVQKTVEQIIEQLKGILAAI